METEIDMYHIRVTSEDEKYSKLLKENFGKYIQVLEEADDEVNRTHTHSHVEEPLLKERSIRNKYSLATDKNKNKMFSMTIVRDKRKNLCYICKGKDKDTLPIVIINNLLTTEDIEKYHRWYWEENTRLKEATGASRPKKKPSFLENCIKEAQTDKYKEAWTESGFEYITQRQKRVMFSLVTFMLGEHRKILDAMIIRRLCNGVFNVILPLKYRDDQLYEQVYGDSIRLGD